MSRPDRHARHTLAAATLAVCLLIPSFARSQDLPPAPQEPTGGQKVAEGEAQAKETRSFFPALFRNLGEDLKHIPRRNSLYWLAGGGALALATHPYDDDINNYFLRSNSSDAFFAPGKYIGSLPVILGAGITTWAIGAHGDKPRARHLGMDIIEASLLSEGIVELTKVAVRRQRPFDESGNQAAGYSFPSGHATMTFAAATVLQQHLGWKAAVPTYLVASYVAMSRLYDNRHWASDVVFGAATGIIIGRSVTWHGRHFYASPTLLPRGIGIAVDFNAR
jgi:hypothetical protein